MSYSDNKAGKSINFLLDRVVPFLCLSTILVGYLGYISPLWVLIPLTGLLMIFLLLSVTAIIGYGRINR